jgi:D-amino-acid oxidase
LLLKAGFSVQIWARDLSPNTTSNSAGAFWYPYLCNPRVRAVEWAAVTLRYLKENAITDPDSGCIARSITEVFYSKVDAPWWGRAVELWRRPTVDELPTGYVDGFETETVLMEATRYIDWLMAQFKELGGSVEQREIRSIGDVVSVRNFIVNCTGLGARELVRDESMYPIRGQVVRVRPNGFDRIITDSEGPNSPVVIMPRLNDIILGGTAQANDWNLEVDPNDTNAILQKARILSPAFNDVDVIDVAVGLRPGRPEVRLEVERFGDNMVVHNYGHGGGGFTLSWGCAAEVVNKLKRHISQ